MSLSRTSDTFYAFRFLRLLTTPWEKTGAFKQGIIDKDGKVIKKPETSKEKAVYNIFHKLVFNLKRLINKVPLGKKTTTSYLAALYLIREHANIEDSDLSFLLEKITDIKFPMIAESSGVLEDGEYVLKNDVSDLHGDIVAYEGQQVVLENVHKIDSILNEPVYSAYLKEASSPIILTQYDV